LQSQVNKSSLRGEL